MSDAPPVESEKEPPAVSPRPAAPTDAPHAKPKIDTKAQLARAPMPRWKKVLLVVASVLFLVGLMLRFVGDAESATQPTGAPGIGSALIDGGTGTESSTEGTGAAAWSPGLMALGFSFFVGFAVGTLLRVFVKLALVVAGLVFLSLTGLSYLELVTVNWDAMDQIFQNFAARIGSDFDSLRTVVTGRLPQAGLGALGLVAGLKKR